MKIDYTVYNIQSEVDVETKIILPILKSIGYSDKEINQRVPVSFHQGRKLVCKEADIVATSNGNLPDIVIEAKNPKTKLDDCVIAQLDSYAFGLEYKYGLICNGIEIMLREYISANKKITRFRIELSDFESEDLKNSICSNENDIYLENTTTKKSAQSFATILRSIHQTIRNVDKLDPTGAFDGWSKLLFMKIYEEKWSKENNNKIRFSYNEFLKNKAVDRHAAFINDTFNETKKAYPQIFENSEEQIGLSLIAIEKILEILDGINILEMPFDIKGKAFEIFLSSTFRGKGLGQFFTPREVVNFMIDFTSFKVDDVILDPACGTGGFLIGAFHKIRKIIDNIPKSHWKEIKTNKIDYLETIKKYNLYGVDAEPRAAKTAKMNMIMWGDGENVFRGNGLDTCDINGHSYPFNKIPIDIILANPPFGTKEEDKDILNKYILSQYTKKTECLFIEKALKILRPNGKLSIVLPDAILGSDSMKNVRNYILRNARIIGVISLPKHTFSPSGVQTINTSLLFLEKYNSEELELISTFDSNEDFEKYIFKNPYNIFMGVAQEIGYEPNGKKSKNCTFTDLDSILNVYKSYDTSAISDNIISIDNKTLSVPIKQLIVHERFDARYYWFMEELKNKKFKRVPLKNYIQRVTRKIDPKEETGTYFSIVSVTNKYGIILDEDDPKKYFVPAEDFNQKYHVVSKGDIVYNPYRVNVGSIGIVNSEYQDMLVSPAYVLFKTKNGLQSKTLLSLMKHPFYKMYIDILSTGSVRNSFSYKYLEKLEIPEVLITSTSEEIQESYELIDKLNKKLNEAQNNLIDKVGKYII